MTFTFAVFQASGNNYFSSNEFNNNKTRKSKQLLTSRFISISGGMRFGPGAFFGFVFFNARSSSSIVIGGSMFRGVGG